MSRRVVSHRGLNSMDVSMLSQIVIHYPLIIYVVHNRLRKGYHNATYVFIHEGEIPSIKAQILSTRWSVVIDSRARVGGWLVAPTTCHPPSSRWLSSPKTHRGRAFFKYRWKKGMLTCNNSLLLCNGTKSFSLYTRRSPIRRCLISVGHINTGVPTPISKSVGSLRMCTFHIIVWD